MNKNRSVRTVATRFNPPADAAEPMLSGYFVLFNVPFYVDEMCEEVIMPGALDGADMSDVRVLVDHIPHLVLARANDKVQTLTFSIDETGVYADVKVNPADGDAMNLYARAQRGDVDQASFSFDECDVRYVDLPDGRVRREIHGISKVYELTVCTFPAYEQTYVEARSRIMKELSDKRRQLNEERRSALRKKFKHRKDAKNA